MKPLFRPALHASRRAAPLTRPALGALLMLSAFGASAQQWTAGQTEWNASGCAGCHTGGSFPLTQMQTSYANNTVALGRLNTAINNQGGMAIYRAGQGSALSDAQRNNLSYYISNFRAEGAAFLSAGGPMLTVASVGQTAQATIRLQNNGKALLRVNMSGGQTVTGDTAQFLPVMGVGSGCDAQSINPGAFCEVTVTYRPQVVPASQHSLTVTFTHNGEPTTTSAVTITGRVSAAPAPAPTPAPAPAPSSDGGGGALPLTLWATLLPAALVARRRRD
jgi:mono/diheme cytochrome c family protein